MKRYSLIMAMLVLFGISLSSCSAGAHIGTKHHKVCAGAQGALIEKWMQIHRYTTNRV